jgi:CRP-like cAMP-binding protein
MSIESSSISGRELSNNYILDCLAAEEYAWLRPALKPVELRHGEVIQQHDAEVEHAYFVQSGLVSLQVVAQRGRVVEVTVAGCEGFIGLSVLAGSGKAFLRAQVEVPGTALRIDADVLRSTAAHLPGLGQIWRRYTIFHIGQLAQMAACNGSHQLEPRLARWLLMVQDRTGVDRLPVTHEFLSHMLVTNRATVSLAAEALRAAGLIHYTRGQVQIVNRGGLQKLACECYAVLRSQLNDYMAGTRPGSLPGSDGAHE